MKAAPIRGIKEILGLRNKEKIERQQTTNDRKEMSPAAALAIGGKKNKFAAKMMKKLQVKANRAKAAVVVAELNKAAVGISAVLTKLGRAAELRELEYTVGLIGDWLRSLTTLTKISMNF